MKDLFNTLVIARQIIRDNIKPDITDNELHKKLKLINSTILKYQNNENN